MMTLPRTQQRALDAIAAALQASEPRLAAMFAMFGRLTEDDAAPRREELPTLRWYRLVLLRPSRLLRAARHRPAGPRRARERRQRVVRALILGQVALAVVIGAVLLGLTSHSSPACGKGDTARVARFTGRAAVPDLGCALSAERGGR
jgi:hypothetical protein